MAAPTGAKPPSAGQMAASLRTRNRSPQPKPSPTPAQAKAAPRQFPHVIAQERSRPTRASVATPETRAITAAAMTDEVSAAVEDPRAVKCPRCWRWHGVIYNTRWPVESLGDGLTERHVICDRCQKVLLTDHPAHTVCVSILENLNWQRETRPWQNAEQPFS